MSHDITVWIKDWDDLVGRGSYGWIHGNGYYSEKRKGGAFQTEVLVPARLSFSDYSGSTAERSNARVWARDFADSKDEAWTDLPGSHGTSAIAIRVSEMTEEMTEFLAALEDYPIADDSDHSDLTVDAENEAWRNWYEREFVKLAKTAVTEEAIEAYPDADPDFVEDAIDKAFDELLSRQAREGGVDTIYTMFDEARESANVYWEEQTGGDMYIDVKRVVEKGLDTEAVLEFFEKERLVDVDDLAPETDDERALRVARENPDQLPLKFNGLRGRNYMIDKYRVTVDDERVFASRDEEEARDAWVRTKRDTKVRAVVKLEGWAVGDNGRTWVGGGHWVTLASADVGR